MFHPNSNELSKMDQEITSLIEKEKSRQENGLELIASENYASQRFRNGDHPDKQIR